MRTHWLNTLGDLVGRFLLWMEDSGEWLGEHLDRAREKREARRERERRDQ
jgi:hypothetical protein